MRKMLMLASVLLFAAAWLPAQDSSQQTPMNSGQSTTSNQTSVEGCLQGANGNFSITDNTGTTYQLQGDASTLSKHVGHEVRVTGTTSNAGTPTSTDNASQGASQPTLMVQKLKHISANCKNMSK